MKTPRFPVRTTQPDLSFRNFPLRTVSLLISRIIDLLYWCLVKKEDVDVFIPWGNCLPSAIQLLVIPTTMPFATLPPKLSL